MTDASFARFSELPRELQFQIWEHALDNAEGAASRWVTDLRLYYPLRRRNLCPLFVSPPLYRIRRMVYILPIEKRGLRLIFEIMDSSKSAREATYIWWRKRLRSLPLSGHGNGVRQRVVDVLEQLLRHIRGNTT